MLHEDSVRIKEYYSRLFSKKVKLHIYLNLIKLRTAQRRHSVRPDKRSWEWFIQ